MNSNRSDSLLFSLLGACIGCFLAYSAATLVLTIFSGLFIGPIRSDLLELQYGSAFRWATGLTVLIGGWAGFALGSVYGRRYYLKALAKDGNPGAIGPLTEGLTDPDEQLRSQVVEALCRLLSDVPPGQLFTLTQRQRSNLYRTLTVQFSITYPDFTVLLLDHVSIIGDPKIIPYVTALSEYKTRNERLGKVVRLASKVLPTILANCAIEKNSVSLLRAAEESNSREHRLLRAITPSSDPTPHQLLKPSTSDAENQDLTASIE